LKKRGAEGWKRENWVRDSEGKEEKSWAWSRREGSRRLKRSSERKYEIGKCGERMRGGMEEVKERRKSERIVGKAVCNK